uniref:Uncharacterized protein n=1 Tax=Anopheles farauti TaxID=69004 RepID=A0A182QZM9_9DIPT
MLEYMQGKDFGTVWNGFFNLATIRDLGKFLVQQGVSVYDYIDIVANFIGQTPVSGRSENLPMGLDHQHHGGLKGYVDELFAVLPIHEWSELYEHKRSTSPPFQALVAKIQGINVEELIHFYTVCTT